MRAHVPVEEEDGLCRQTAAARLVLPSIFPPLQKQTAKEILAHWSNGEWGYLGMRLLFVLCFLNSCVMMSSEKGRTGAGGPGLVYEKS